MKFRYLLTALVAGVALLASCEKEADHFLDEVKVSSSYVAIPQTGGSTTIDLTATASWAVTGAPDWLTISSLGGSAGSSKLTFSAASTLDGRNCEVYVECAGKTQIINVIQGLATISPASCAEVNKGIEGKTYRVTGVVTKIANTSYGNFYINDGTDELYIYGLVDAGGSYNWSKFGIDVGDEVTVEGPLAIYNGTYELKDAQWIKTNKSLIKVDSINPEDATLPSKGGDISITLENKGTGLYVELPEELDWLSIKSVAGNTVTFTAAENVAGPRTASLVFKTVSGGKEYTAELAIAQLGAKGSLALPYTVEEAIEAALSGSLGDTKVYVKGIVSELVSGFGPDYGNGSFWISADGTKYGDLALDFEVYQAYWLGGAKWTADNPQIAVGAEVVVYGPLTTYKGIAETAGKGAAYVYSVNGVTSDANGIGSLEAPFDCVGAIKAAVAAPGSKVYVKGIVSELVSGGMSATFKNGSFWISDDGAKHGDLTLDFEAYQVKWLGGQDWIEGTHPQIAVNDKVVLYGPLTTYKGTSETAGKGAAYIYSLNDATE